MSYATLNFFYRNRPSPEEEEPSKVNTDPEGKVRALPKPGKKETTLSPSGANEKYNVAIQTFQTGHSCLWNIQYIFFTVSITLLLNTNLKICALWGDDLLLHLKQLTFFLILVAIFNRLGSVWVPDVHASNPPRSRQDNVHNNFLFDFNVVCFVLCVCVCVCSVFCSSFFGMGRDGRGRLGSWEKQRRC